MIEIMPGTLASAKAVVAKAMEDAGPDDVIFIVRLSGDEAIITSSAFKTRDIAWAAQILNGYALTEAMK